MQLYLLKLKEQHVEYDMYTEMLIQANSMEQARDMAEELGGKDWNVISMVTCEPYNIPDRPCIIYADYNLG